MSTQSMTENMIEKVAANNLPNVDDLWDMQWKKPDLHQKREVHIAVHFPGYFIRIFDLIYQFSLKSRSEYTGNGQYSSSVSVSSASASSLAFAISLKMVLW